MLHYLSAALYTQIHPQVESPNHCLYWEVKGKENHTLRKKKGAYDDDTLCIVSLKRIPSQNEYFPVLEPQKGFKLRVIQSFATSIFVEKWAFNFFCWHCSVECNVEQCRYVFHSISRIYIPLYFSNTRLYVSNLCATLMPVETGVWDNKERCIGSLWGDQHYELEYNCGRGVTAIYAPFQRQGRWGGGIVWRKYFLPKGGRCRMGGQLGLMLPTRRRRSQWWELFFVARLQDESLHGDCVTGMLPQPMNRIIIKGLPTKPTQCHHFFLFTIIFLISSSS